MRAELDRQLIQDFPFMMPYRTYESNPYNWYGTECGDGWYELIHDLCQAITERYEQDRKSVDLVVTQVKQKCAELRFYYEYENDSTDEATSQLRNDIADIVSACEDKSWDICEYCGAASELREWNDWYLTLCDSCWKKYLEKKDGKQV